MAAPLIADRHKHHFHQKSPIKEPVRAATTANITIATALNNGDSLDGVTLATDDRVLVKDQSTGSQNGIYIVGVTPVRAYDVSTDDPDVRGAEIRVLEGTTNGSTTWVNTNTTLPTIGTTALTFAAMGGSGAPTTADYLVGTAQAGLSAEIVVGTTPGGELGGTWPSPTIDASHAGSDHLQPVRKNSTGSVFSRRRLNLIEGSNVTLTVADDAGDDEVDVTIAASVSGSGLTVQDEGTPLTTDATTLNFTGAGVTASGAGATKTINIPGGGGSMIAYGSLKPGSPTMDFTGSDLASATAHQSSGTFTTGDAYEAADDGSHISIAYHDSMGALHWPASNVDQELWCGGLTADGTVQKTNAGMYGPALLNSAGTGVGLLIYGDGNAYLADIVTWNYNTNFGQIANIGHDVNGLPWYERLTLRLTRVGNTWDGYISLSGNAWDYHTTATGSKTITVDRKCIGMFYNTASTYKGLIRADYLHTV